TTPSYPPIAAQCSGVFPHLVTVFGLTSPQAKSILTTPSRPSWAARCSGIWP
ncbi:hypothetical protein L873DRAFT_1680129, partial [Choiromyces venosus 120613-1]